MPPTLRLRRLWLTSHLYLGLSLGLLLALLGLTGSFLVFHHAIDEQLNPRLLRESAPGPHRSLAEVVAAASAATLDQRPTARLLMPPRHEGGVYVVYHTEPFGPDHNARLTEVHVDPQDRPRHRPPGLGRIPRLVGLRPPLAPPRRAQRRGDGRVRRRRPADLRRHRPRPLVADRAAGRAPGRRPRQAVAPGPRPAQGRRLALGCGAGGGRAQRGLPRLPPLVPRPDRPGLDVHADADGREPARARGRHPRRRRRRRAGRRRERLPRRPVDRHEPAGQADRRVRRDAPPPRRGPGDLGPLHRVGRPAHRPALADLRRRPPNRRRRLRRLAVPPAQRRGVRPRRPLGRLRHRADPTLLGATGTALWWRKRRSRARQRAGRGDRATVSARAPAIPSAP